MTAVQRTYLKVAVALLTFRSAAIGGIYRAHLSHRLKGLVLVLSLPFVAHELTQIKRQRVGGIGAR